MFQDVRKAKCVDVPELSHLKDCIVFSTQGDRPMYDMIAGSDVDGDEYLVSDSILNC